MKRLLLSLLVVGLVAMPAMAQMERIYVGAQEISASRAPVDPPVYLESTIDSGDGWFWGTTGSGYADDIHTIYSTVNGGAGNDFLLTGFDVSWYSQSTNTNHVMHFTVNFYANDPTDYTGYYAGTVWVPQAPALLGSYTMTDDFVSAPGARFRNTAVDLTDDLGEADIMAPADLWMEVQLNHTDPVKPWRYIIADDWPQNGAFPIPPAAAGGAEVGFSDWWFSGPGIGGGWEWTWFGKPGPFWYHLGVAPDDYWEHNGSPAGNFCISVHGIPEPATLGLLALSGLAMIRRRR